MKVDLSVAPEIARLAGSWDVAGAERVVPHEARPVGGPAVTVGYLAGCLRALVADPERWWGLVRFDARQALRVPVPAPGRCEAWLVVAPPGDRGDGPGYDQGWSVACVVAGELERRPGGRPLMSGRVLVRGAARSGRLVNVGGGYAISLHARAATGTS